MRTIDAVLDEHPAVRMLGPASSIVTIQPFA
jgi:hypothetical protein